MTECIAAHLHEELALHDSVLVRTIFRNNAPFLRNRIIVPRYYHISSANKAIVYTCQIFHSLYYMAVAPSVQFSQTTSSSPCANEPPPSILTAATRSRTTRSATPLGPSRPRLHHRRVSGVSKRQGSLSLRAARPVDRRVMRSLRSGRGSIGVGRSRIEGRRDV